MDGFLDALRRSLFPVQVLLVDDDGGARHALRRVLERQGYSVVEAAEGADALDLLEASHVPVDLMITDVQMPGMRGDELGQRVRARYPDLPILYISGERSFAHLGEDTSAPTHFLAKPFTAAELGDALRLLLGTIDATAEAFLRPAGESGA